MEEILRIIVEYVSIWGPSLVAIFGVVTTVITALNKTKEAINELKADNTLKTVNSQLEAVVKENKELVRCNKLLLDEITKIQNYADSIKKGD